MCITHKCCELSFPEYFLFTSLLAYFLYVNTDSCIVLTDIYLRLSDKVAWHTVLVVCVPWEKNIKWKHNCEVMFICSSIFFNFTDHLSDFNIGIFTKICWIIFYFHPKWSPKWSPIWIKLKLNCNKFLRISLRGKNIMWVCIYI